MGGWQTDKRFRWGSLVTGLCLIIIGLGMIFQPVQQPVLAFGSYPSAFPNGTASVNNCDLCHIGSVFSKQYGPFRAALTTLNISLSWMGNAGIAILDSDGDGFTNGEELQDPAGTWTSANGNPFGDSAYVSNPNQSSSLPIPPQVTNLVGVSQGQILVGSRTISAEMRYAGLSRVVFSLTNAGGSEVYSSTVSYNQTNYAAPYCMGSAPGTCQPWDSTSVPNGTYTLTVTAFDKRIAGGPQTGSRSVTSVQVNNTIIATDFTVSKNDSADPVAVGKLLTYTLAIRNQGPDPSGELTVNDFLPDSLDLASFSPSGLCTSFGGNNVNCLFSSVAVGEMITVTIAATTTQLGLITNVVFLAPVDFDPDLTNNVFTETTLIATSDLELHKESQAAMVTLGEPLAYTLHITNHGPEIATNLVLTDTLHPAVVLASASPGCTPGAGLVRCDLGSLADQGSTSVTVTITPTINGLITNTAFVQSTPSDSNLSNNQATVTTFVATAGYQPHLFSIVKDDNRLRMVNPVTGRTVDSVEITMAGQQVNHGTGLSAHPGTGQLYALLKLQGQQGRELALIDPVTGVATPIGDTGGGVDRRFSTLTVDAQGIIYSVTGDGSPADSQTLFTLSPSDAGATKVMDLGNGDAGEAITYNTDDGLLYHASGYGAQNSVSTGEIFESIDPNAKTVTLIPLSGADYQGSNALLYEGGRTFLLADCGLGGEDACTRPFVSRLFRVTGDGLVIPLSDLDHLSKGLAVGADLLVSQQTTPPPLEVDVPFTYTITLANAGYLTATNVVITDTLPEEVNLGLVLPVPPICTPIGRTVSCHFGTLAKDDTRQVTLVVTPTLETTLINTVTVRSDNPDPNLGNNRSVGRTRIGVILTYLPVVAKE